VTRRDRGIVAALSVALVVFALATAMPSVPSLGGPPSSSADAGSPTPGAQAPAVYREGTVGGLSSINPLTARTQADRDVAALVFSGLVAIGPDGGYRPDLASAWSADAKGKRWTFTIRPDARWQDGEPVTADDVLFTVGILHDARYTGPLGASWRDVTVSANDSRTVTFELAAPLGGFLQAATIGLLPAHLLRDVPVANLADDPFSLHPVGSGPFILASWDSTTAELVAASTLAPPAVDPFTQPSTAPSASHSAEPSTVACPSSVWGGSPCVASPLPSAPTGPSLRAITFTFFADAVSLAAAYRAGGLDAASGLPATLADELALLPGNRLLRYPRTTLTAVALNLRPGNDALRVPGVRRALLAAIDRDAIIATVFGGAATRADTPIPPSSWAFDPKASAQVRFDPKAAAAGFKAAGWKKAATGWIAPGAKKAYTIEIISPDAVSNPAAMAVAEAVAAGWRTFGLTVTVRGMPPTEYVDTHLRKGDFQAAVVDVTIGLDPDLYPLFASTQVVGGGSNLTGIQDVDLDRLLTAARAPGTLDQRKRAFAALQVRLADRNYVLPIAFRDELVVVADRVLGPVTRELGDSSDRFWDVLTWRLADAR
jgi:peptide/nickel transport system substrate-binding protein